MEGSGLPSVMAMPNGMTLEWGYEEKRDLVATMIYKRGATRVVEREYAYDSLARAVTRRTARQGIPSTTALPATAGANWPLPPSAAGHTATVTTT